MNKKNKTISNTRASKKSSASLRMFSTIKKFLQPKSTLFRLTIGLSSMVVSLLLLATMVGLVPDKNAAIREGRGQLAEAVAINSSIFITVSDLRRMETNLRIVAERNKDILSSAIRRADGKILVEVGSHVQNWVGLQDNVTKESQVVVPIFESSEEWGQVEFVFKPLVPPGWYGYFYQPVFLLITFMSLACFAFFYLYMGKMLKQLDPSQAIPDRVRSALDTMAEGLLVIDAGQDIVMANLAFTTIAGESAEELVGRQITSLAWSDKDKNLIDKNSSPWAKTLDDGMTRTSNMIRLNFEEDESKTFMTNCSPILSGSGKPAGVLVSFDDVTELEQKEIELRISKDEAEQANKFKSEFLANMSHEIRTPMNAILGFSEVLKRGYDKNNEDSIRYLNTISSSGNHLLSLINDILDLSKVESGKIELEIKPAAAHKIINEVVQIMQIKAKEKGIYLRFEPSGPLPEFIETDAGKFRQIITNLVGNAIKFTQDGGVTIISTMKVNNGVKQLTVDVVDTGIGMTTEQANDVFNPFTQADSSITRRFGGTGLGLTISKSYAEALGGDIIVKSVPGEGSQFSASIDVGEAVSIKQLNVEELLSEAVTVETSDKRWKFADSSVLVVDDGEENRELMKVLLEDVGINVTTAEDGKVALNKLDGSTFDVIFMDVQMPVMDGFTAVGLMRESGCELPIIAMTADAMVGTQQKCLDAGYSEYMSKPIDIDKLMNSLVGLLEATSEDEEPRFVSGSDESTQTINDNREKINIEASDKIYSSLPVNIEKFRVIVERFVTRLEEQIAVIDDAYQRQDYVELKRLGHWLKGSAGSVGFQQLVEPAKQFEQSAIEENDYNIGDEIKNIKSIFERIEIKDSDVPVVTELTIKDDKDYVIPDQIVCQLDDSNLRLRPVIERFILDLSSKTNSLDDAIAHGNYSEIEKVASWLKAAAGSVGFNDFTAPARELEQQAKERRAKRVGELINIIQKMRRQVVLSDASDNAAGLNRA